MKTAISIPDPLFKKGETAARKLKLSRSELYAQALAEYLDRRNEEALIQRVNHVCDAIDTRIDPALVRAAAASLPKDQW